MHYDHALAAVDAWFVRQGWAAFPFQHAVWGAYCAGDSGLIHAATGTGKTYAAWMGALIEALGEAPSADVAPAEATPKKGRARSKAAPEGSPLRVLWITPLRALAADTEAALRAPLADLGLPWTVETRTGDTAAATRARQRQRLPTALITTPESLSLLLTREDAATLFADLRLVVADEWHELMATKRGVQTELCLARLRHWRPALRTWGLSATMGNLDVALRALLGNAATNAQIIQGVEPKRIEIKSIIPPVIERFPWAGHLGLTLLPQVVEAIEAHQSALVFTNTRAQTEIWFGALLDARPDWAGEIALHHSSIDRDTREWVEKALHDGRLRCVVSTSSLDLGVDFAPVDVVLQVGSPKGVARLLQRAGRSGHRPGAASEVVCVPTHAFELVEVAAVREAALSGHIESRPPIEKPLDVLVQHAVTVALGGGFIADELLAEVRTTYAFRDLADDEWAWVLDFITRGGPALQAYPDYQRVAVQDGRYVIASDALGRRHRMSVGTITSDAAIQVQFLRGQKVGSIEESFVSRLKPGDHFTFAGRTLEFVRVRDMVAWVRRSSKNAGLVPRWSGGRMPLSSELSAAVRAQLEDARNGVFDSPEMRAVAPILRLQAERSIIPAHNELLVERTRTREGYHLFIYPFAGRLVHEGMAALVAYRLAQRAPISFAIAANDYGFELLSPTPPPLDQTDDQPDGAEALFSETNLLDDIAASLNATEMARRQFREIARVAGLIFQGFPGSQKTVRQVQASSGLIFDVFQQYDPDNRLLDQAYREVLERQLEQSRLGRALADIRAGSITVRDTHRPTPLAFPLMVDRLRETVSSETFADRVRRMQVQFEKG